MKGCLGNLHIRKIDNISVLWHPQEMRTKAKKKKEEKSLTELLYIMKDEVKKREKAQQTGHMIGNISQSGR